MPHVVLEYTAPLPSALVASVLAKAHAVVGEAPTVDAAAVKSRAYPCTFFHVGNDQGNAGFLHLEVRLLQGRPLDMRAALADRLQAMMQQAVEAHDYGKCAITLEIREMTAQTYRK